MKKDKTNIYDYNKEQNDETAEPALENIENEDSKNKSEALAEKKGKKKKAKKKGRFSAWIKRHKFLTALIIIVIIIIIVVLAVFIARSNQSGTVYSYIRTTTLTKGTLEDSISATGTVESAETSSVTTSLNYTIKSINVSVGDEVSKGDIICVLDSSELETQIEKEKENIAKAVETAQKAYDSAQDSYNDSLSSLDDAESDLEEKKTASNDAYALYKNAENAISSYQNSFDKALSAYNKAGAAYVKAKSNYETAASNFSKNKISASDYISAAKTYMKTVQNYYGGCSVGSYDISDSGSSSFSASSSSASSYNSSSSSLTSAASSTSSGSSMQSSDLSNLNVGDSAESTDEADTSSSGSVSSLSTSSSSQTINVTETADDICSSVQAKVKADTGKTISYSTGTNTLYKLSKCAENLRSAKTACNYSTLESEYNSAYSQYESAQMTYTQCENNVQSAKDQLESAEEQLESSSTSDTLDQLQSSLEDCKLTAGQDGTVISLNATVGSAATGMEAVATIANLNKLKISITIPEADINNASIGLKCNITSDASDDVLTGELTQIDPIASGSGTFGAEVTVDGKSSALKVGMNASVEIIVNSTENVYQVPIDAIGNDDDGLGDYVYRQTGGSGTDMTFEKVYVTTGESNDYYIEIESDDLSEGDVIRSSSDLTEGIETEESDSTSLFDMIGNIGGGNMDRGDDSERGARGGDESFGNAQAGNGSFPGGGF